MASSLSIPSQYYTTLKDDIKTRYDEKIKKCGGVDPYSLSQEQLSISAVDFPKITPYDIGDYMIHSRSPFTNQFLDNFKGTLAFKYFESGFVTNVSCKKNVVSAIIKGQVSFLSSSCLNGFIEYLVLQRLSTRKE